jgi:predicted DsbA family dithiol-disulfide isomerase
VQDEYDIEVNWRGFELHPEIPSGGRSVASLFGEQRAAEYKAYMDSFARNLGVTIHQPNHIPNTRRALAMTEYARDQGLMSELEEALMDAHWLEGRNIEDDDDLRGAAARAGLEPAAALHAADDPVYQTRVDAIRKEAASRNVISIPTFFVDQKRLVGCQPYERLKKLLD